MGRRKSKRKPPPKKKNIMPLDTQFNCPFCNHERSCEVDMDKPRNVGRVSCMICLENFQCTINYLSESVDVYNEWIDACEAANWSRMMQWTCSNWSVTFRFFFPLLNKYLIFMALFRNFKYSIKFTSNVLNELKKKRQYVDF